VKRLLQAALAAIMAGVLVLPGVALAEPGGDTSPTPAPAPVPSHQTVPLFMSYQTGGEYYSVDIPSAVDTQYSPPSLRYGPVLPSAPRSLVVYRGTEVVISVLDIAAYLVPLVGNTAVFDPSGVTPVWASNLGSAIGSVMTSTIVAGHNVYGGVESPLYRLNTVQPGDMIDVTLQSGWVVRFQVDAGGAVLGPKIVAGHELPLRTLTLRSCSPDGKSNIAVTATAVSL